MSNPSLTDFMPKASTPVKSAPAPSKDGEEIKGITIRLKRSQWEHMAAMTMTERTKIQPYIIGLIQADFEKRGLRF